MPQSSYIGAFCLVIALYSMVCEHCSCVEWRNQSFFLQNGKAGSSDVAASSPASRSHQDGEKELSRVFSKTIVPESTTRAIFDLSGLHKEKRGETHHHQLLSHFHGSPSSLKELASTLLETLDNISKNWVLEGAKTIQNGEIRLRKLHKDLAERIEKLVFDGSKYGQHILSCMNRTLFEMRLNAILAETDMCYSQSLLSVHAELKKIEGQQKVVLDRMDICGRKIYEMLSTCFLKDDTPSVIECLQKVDSIHIGNQIKDVEATKLTLEMAGIVNDIPKKFSECTTKGLTATEDYLRKGYAQSLTCLKETIT